MIKSSDILTDKKRIAQHVNLAGGKAANLARLSLSGFQVPDFLVVSAKVYAKRARLQSEKFVDLLKKKLEHHIRANLARDIFAIRSSALMEDLHNHSFAGLYQTFLQVKAKDIYDAITEIWRSVEKTSVKKYSKSLDQQNASIAVIIQKMIQSHVSGVIFTSNPVENASDSMLIEIVEGSCDKLVSGEHPPTRVVYDKRNKTFTIPEKDGLAEQLYAFVDEQKHLENLSRLGLQISELFGSPQDIEWTFDGETFWVLQSRPISTLDQHNPAIHIDAAGVRWSNYFFAERFMQPLSPLGWSFLRPIIRKTALQEPLWYLGYDDIAKAVQLTLIHGFPYSQLENYQKLFGHIPASFISEDKRKTLALPQKTSARLKISNIVALTCRLLFSDFSWFPPYNLWQWKTFCRSMRTKIRKMDERLENMVSKQQYRFFNETQQWSLAFLRIHRWSVTFADLFSAALKKYLQFIKIKEKINIEQLLSGLPHNATVQANEGLAELDVNNQKAFRQFLQEFGHRSESLDIACPTWEEDREHLAKMSSLLKREKSNFNEKQKQNVLSRKKEEKKLRHEIRNRVPSLIGAVVVARILLYYAQQFAMLRENQRDMWHRILRLSRKSACAVAQDFVAKGKIEELHDIFYLHCKEIDAALDSDGQAFQHLVEKRKRQYSRHLKNLESGTEAQSGFFSDDHVKALSGIGVSRGRTRGRARIARNYAQAMDGQPGEILIVPSADPAWSPIFGVVAGLVMERGGVLSHASILAREFQLPTITNVSNATQSVRNGDVIEIDGGEGFIKIIKAGSNNR